MTADPLGRAVAKLASTTLEGPEVTSDQVKDMLRAAAGIAPEPRPEPLSSGDRALAAAAHRGPSRSYLDPRRALDAARTRNRL